MSLLQYFLLLFSSSSFFSSKLMSVCHLAFPPFPLTMHPAISTIDPECHPHPSAAVSVVVVVKKLAFNSQVSRHKNNKKNGKKRGKARKMKLSPEKKRIREIEVENGGLKAESNSKSCAKARQKKSGKGRRAGISSLDSKWYINSTGRCSNNDDCNDILVLNPIYPKKRRHKKKWWWWTGRKREKTK